jgi:hypothetical protein
MFLYSLIIIVILLILWIRNKFWNRQPMRHIYNFPVYGILSTSPIMNKYCDTIHVHEATADEVVEYVTSHSPGYETKDHLMGYLQNAYITVYKSPDIQGCMTSRRIQMWDDCKKTAYFHDFIYANSDTIKRKLFQTHEYMRMLKTKCMISIFSYEKCIPFLIPVTRYTIQWVKTNTFQKYVLPKRSWIRATPTMLYPLHEAFKSPFRCQISPDILNIATMIQSKLLSVYYYYTTELVAILFFKNTFQLEKNEAIVDWIGTISLKNDNIENAISTLFYTFRKMYPIVRIHQVSHTPLYCGYKTSELVYYIYNYGIERIPPKECLII